MECDVCNDMECNAQCSIALYCNVYSVVCLCLSMKGTCMYLRRSSYEFKSLPALSTSQPSRAGQLEHQQTVMSHLSLYKRLRAFGATQLATRKKGTRWQSGSGRKTTWLLELQGDEQNTWLLSLATSKAFSRCQVNLSATPKQWLGLALAFGNLQCFQSSNDSIVTATRLLLHC